MSALPAAFVQILGSASKHFSYRAKITKIFFSNLYQNGRPEHLIVPLFIFVRCEEHLDLLDVFANSGVTMLINFLFVIQTLN